MQEACVLCVGGCIDHHDWLSATLYVPEWVESWLQEFGAVFVYALDRHSHGGSLSVLGHSLVESWLQEFGAAFVYAVDRHSHGGSLSGCTYWPYI